MTNLFPQFTTWQTTVIEVMNRRYARDVSYFEYPDAHFIKGFDHIRKYVFGVEVDPNEEIIVNGREHSQFRWCSFQEAIQRLKWEENKKALSRLNEILKTQ